MWPAAKSGCVHFGLPICRSVGVTQPQATSNRALAWVSMFGENQTTTPKAKKSTCFLQTSEQETGTAQQISTRLPHWLWVCDQAQSRRKDSIAVSDRGTCIWEEWGVARLACQRHSNYIYKQPVISHQAVLITDWSPSTSWPEKWIEKPRNLMNWSTYRMVHMSSRAHTTSAREENGHLRRTKELHRIRLITGSRASSLIKHMS